MIAVASSLSPPSYDYIIFNLSQKCQWNNSQNFVSVENKENPQNIKCNVINMNKNLYLNSKNMNNKWYKYKII